MGKTKVGIVGCGNISSIYLKNGNLLEAIDIAAVADLDMERARAKAEEYSIPKFVTTEELLADPEIELVLNLTTPHAHFDVNKAALMAGKHVYVEKPLAVTREDGEKTLQLANDKGLLVGGAPDTFMGAGIQTCRKLIDDGWIGRPVAAVAFMTCHGHESWHPDPEFYYERGGGPMFDMGPYYLTALVTLLGGVKRVSGSAAVSFPQRTITSKPKYGKVIDVEVPTHVAGVMDFVNGAVGTIVTSFDVWAAELPRIEIYGSEGSLSVPDPNSFGGPVRIRRAGDTEWREMPLTHGYAENSRGIGVADLANAARNSRPARANGDLTYHVLEIMHGFHDAADDGKHYYLKSTANRPAPLPMNLAPFTID